MNTNEIKSALNHGAKIYKIGEIQIVAINIKNAEKKVFKQLNSIGDNKYLSDFLMRLGMKISAILYIISPVEKSKYFERDIKAFIHENIKEL